MNLEDLIGNQKVKDALENTIQSKNILHSYLFIGEEGIGKKIFAKEFAKAILCTEEKKPCGTCKSCIEIEQHNQPDYSEILPDGNSIKIEQIRNMQIKVFEKPIISKNKVYIIEDADKMTKEAQNALLKTLEEPPEYVTIILITSNESNLLNTIKSRCTKIVFEPIEKELLKKYAQEELKKDVSEEILVSSMGSIGRLRNNIEKESIYKPVYELLQKIESTSLLDFIKQAESIYKSKENSNEILEYIISLLLILAKEKTEKQMAYIYCIEIVDTAKKNIISNGNYDMQIDQMLIKMWEEIHEKDYRSSF